MKDFANRNIPEFAAAVQHLGHLTGVECNLNEVPALKAMGLFSLPTISEDLVRIATKYGISENVTTEVESSRRQFVRILNALIAKGVISESAFDAYFD